MDSSLQVILRRDELSNLSACREREWLVTNGRGGYAMAAVNQMLTRRYHGLLVAAVRPPVERFVLLAKLDATVRLEGLTYELATNDYPEAVEPQGFKLLESFRLDPCPTWTWRVGAAVIEQRVWMIAGEDSTFVQFVLNEGAETVQISLRPLCTSRHFHHLSRYQEIGPPTVDEGNDRLVFSWSGARPQWQLSHNGQFKSRSDWYYQFVLMEEARRGYDSMQDLFTPGVITAELKRDDPDGLILCASTSKRAWRDWTKSTPSKADAPVSASFEGDSLSLTLARAADDFIVQRDADRRTLIAGYPWFGDWGRDTFISLPGLCLVTGRFKEARSIIEAFSHYVEGGMIPNCFPNYGDAPQYNTVDASLWYIHAIDRYLNYSGDWNFISEQMYEVVANILDAHERGTCHNIGVEADGLLAAGETGHALTWMDAKLPDRAITPRIGKPVEINALWYNALAIASSFAARMGDLQRADQWQRMASRCAAAFNKRFWNESSSCLFDVVDVDGRDGDCDDALRPNQLLAVSLTHPVLDRSHWRSVVDVCQRELWTPMGLRTLSPNNRSYCGTYQGDTAARDSAYHQGTVWPWLLGPFVTAFVRAYGATPQSRSAARHFLDGLEPHLSQAGLGSVSEVADGDPPHRPGGCPWQAWSVAEPLRAICEDVLAVKPPQASSIEPRRNLASTT